ncbi:MAG TPA: hypothetical protein VKV29_02615 [Chthonomonas sp.]|nr:hypothetical protein [Chthonomonas sp.]HLH79159.1 hypothetical protein [Chthonomonas sp.]
MTRQSGAASPRPAATGATAATVETGDKVVSPPSDRSAASG